MVGWARVSVSPTAALPTAIASAGLIISYLSIDVYDIINKPHSSFYLIFFGKSRIITIESLEADRQGSSHYLPSPPTGNWANSRISAVAIRHGEKLSIPQTV